MIKKSVPVLLLLLCIDSLAFQVDSNTKRLEKELVTRLRWESIWADSGIILHPSPNGSAKLAIYLTGQFVTFCSHDLGICEMCQMRGLHLGKGVKSERCDENALPCGPNKDDETAVRIFSREVLRTSPMPPVASQPRITLNAETPRGLAGALVWSMTANLGTPSQITEEYRTSRPPQLQLLKDWLLVSNRGAGYASITIACFLPSDPLVYFYGDRPMKGPVIFEAVWDDETEKWTDAGFLDGPADLKQIERLKTRIRALSCAKVAF